jgi:hypothetical protein
MRAIDQEEQVREKSKAHTQTTKVRRWRGATRGQESRGAEEGMQIRVRRRPGARGDEIVVGEDCQEM